MAKPKLYTVTVNKTPPNYPEHYFPRQFRYHTDAIRCAKLAANRGSHAVVEHPNGNKDDYPSDIPKASITESQKFKDASNGYGFEEVQQQPEGIYCAGCCTVHKRPTKMYTNGDGRRDFYCKSAVVRFYWEPESSE